MRFVKAAAFVLVALLGVGGWVAYRAGWRPRLSHRAPSPSAENTEPPRVEFDETRSGPAGKTEILLYIRRDLATLQAISFGANGLPQCCQEGKPKSTHLTCDELAWLSQGMKDELASLAPVYGSEQTTNQGEISIVYRWNGPERRVVWRNPESSPKPPEGAWARLVGPLEEIKRRAQQRADWPSDDTIIEYGKTEEYLDGRNSTVLSINKSGRAFEQHIESGGVVGGVHISSGQTQLAPEELAALLRTFVEAKFADFQPCYGQHTRTNRQNAYLFYRGNGIRSAVTWMNAGSDPKPPEGWFRIVEILDPIQARAQKQPYGQP